MHSAGGAGMLFAITHGIYIVNRLHYVTVVSRDLLFSLFSLASTFLLGAFGGYLYFNANSNLEKIFGLMVATFQSWASAIYTYIIMATFNALYFKPETGIKLYNFSLSQMPVYAFSIVFPLMVLIYSVVSYVRKEEAEDEDGDTTNERRI